MISILQKIKEKNGGELNSSKSTWHNGHEFHPLYKYEYSFQYSNWKIFIICFYKQSHKIKHKLSSLYDECYDSLKWEYFIESNEALTNFSISKSFGLFNKKMKIKINCDNSSLKNHLETFIAPFIRSEKLFSELIVDDKFPHKLILILEGIPKTERDLIYILDRLKKLINLINSNLKQELYLI